MLLPAATVCVPGVALSVKLGGGGGALTVSATLPLWVSVPLVPVMLSVELPSGVVALVLTVSVELPDPVTVDGEKLASAPAGSPLALSVTAPLKPLTAPMFT